jgi:hypothetical protein
VACESDLDRPAFGLTLSSAHRHLLRIDQRHWPAAHLDLALLHDWRAALWRYCLCDQPRARRHHVPGVAL